MLPFCETTVLATAILVAFATPAISRKPQGMAPPLMPPALVDSSESGDTGYLGAQSDFGYSGQVAAAPAQTPTPSLRATTQAKRSSPVRLGLQGAAVAQVPGHSSLFAFGESFVGGRLFSRLSLGGRWYLVPSVGYYRRTQGALPANQTDNLLELGVALQFAVLRLGPVGLLAGVSQRVGWRFTSDATGLWGTWQYRLGPGAAINVRLSESTSLFVGSDLTYPLAQPTRPEWTAHGGLLFAL